MGPAPGLRAASVRGLRLAGRIVLGVLVLAVLLVAAAAATAGAGVWETVPHRSVEQRSLGLPAWTRGCWNGHESNDTTVCVRVKGRIVWVQHHDPDGDGDRHVALVSRFHVRLVKVPAILGAGPLPGRGQELTAIGYDLRGASGHQEIDAARLSWDDHVYDAPPVRGRSEHAKGRGAAAPRPQRTAGLKSGTT
jgi:hypothetical protein